MESTGDVQQLPDLQDLDIPEDIRPMAVGDTMPKEAIVIMFVSHTCYYRNGRQLVREETLTLMRRYLCTNDYRMNHVLFEKLENPNAALTTALGCLENDKVQAVIAYVDRLFTKLRNEDPEFEARARILSGFPGRLPRVDLGVKTDDALMLRKRQLEPHQYLFQYTAVKWGTDRENKAFDEEQITGVLCFHYKFDSRITKTAINYCSKILANPNHRITKQVAPVAEMYKTFFKDKVDKEFAEYEKSKTQGSSSGSISEVTRALESSTLQATASASNQSNAVEPRLEFPESAASGKRRQELLGQAARGQEDKSGKGNTQQKRKKKSEPPEKESRRRPPPPPPPAAGPSHTPRSLPYDPARDR